ncbi:MAG: sulfatase-like hydrolase/transferase [Bacteroidales bacterium]|nr:sulfatase-like hydrolase/transferase [Bacteroidales bacterium]
MDNLAHKSNRFQTYNINYQIILLYRFLLLMALFTISRLGFYYFNTGHYPDMTFERLMRIMQGGFKFDVTGILYVNVLYILLYHLPFPFRNTKSYSRFLKWWFFISNGIALAANVGDFFYFDFILKRSTADVFMFAKEGNIVTLFIHFIVDYWQGLVFWLLQMAVLIWGYDKVKLLTEVKPKKLSFYLSAVFWLLISVYFSVIGIRGGFTGTTRPITLGNAGAYTQKPLEMAIVLNTPFSIIRTLNKKPLKEEHYFPDEELKQIYSPIHPAHTSGAFKPLNVVVLIMESFAKEYVGAYNRNLDHGEYRGYTPFLDSLIGKSKCFQYSFANGRKSIDALPSITSSIPSMVNPYVTSVYASNKINSLALTLKKKGYETAFFHGAPNGSMGFDAFMKVAGYDQYYGMTEYGNDDDFDGSWGIWDEEFMQYMADEFGKLKQPFLATFFSVSSHHPFKVPQKYEGAFRKGTLEFHIPIQYSDLALRKFFAKASKEPWFINTLFVLTADHSNHAWHPEYKTSIGDFSIPILFYQPADTLLRGVDSTSVAQQIDIMPTILDYLNYDKEYFAFGVDLLDSSATKFAVNYNNSTYQLIQGKYLLQFLNGKTIAVYNYVNDPLLKTNLIGKVHDIQAKTEKMMKAFIQQYNNRMIHNQLVVN